MNGAKKGGRRGNPSYLVSVLFAEVKGGGHGAC
jgi:hypothetical protein